MNVTKLAATGGGRVGNPLLGGLSNLSPADFFGKLISTLVNGIILIGGVAFFIMLLIGGIGWITAGGDKAKLQAAQAKITQAGIGFLVLFAIWAVIKLVETVFGITILTIDITSLIIQ